MLIACIHVYIYSIENTTSGIGNVFLHRLKKIQSKDNYTGSVAFYNSNFDVVSLSCAMVMRQKIYNIPIFNCMQIFHHLVITVLYQGIYENLCYT